MFEVRWFDTQARELHTFIGTEVTAHNVWADAYRTGAKPTLAEVPRDMSAVPGHEVTYPYGRPFC